MRLDKRYYHKSILNTLKFLIPPNKKVLYMGSYNGEHLSKLNPSMGIGVEEEKEAAKRATKRYKKIKFAHSPYESYIPKEEFDFVVLEGVLGKSPDLMRVLGNVRTACNENTRVVVYQHNPLWQWALNLSEKVGLKRKEGVVSWLSLIDVEEYLKSSGFEICRVFRKTLFPMNFFGLGSLINDLTNFLPFFDVLKLDQYIVARPLLSSNRFKKEASLTICITVKDEKENIEPIVKKIPKFVEKQEILFVEGHSRDGTREEIKRVSNKYRNKNVRLLVQKGLGQGDAIKIGFREARGSVIVLFEGDGTSDPKDIKFFYESIVNDRAEFIEGSRLVYPLDEEVMPFVNRLGNIFFAKWFSFFLGQSTTDVLSGIKAIKKVNFERILSKWGFIGIEDPFGDFELVFGAARAGLRFGEIPIHYYPRAYGESKTKIIGHGLILLKMAIKGYFTFRFN